jgi:hypothetical protein
LKAPVLKSENAGVALQRSPETVRLSAVDDESRIVGSCRFLSEKRGRRGAGSVSHSSPICPAHFEVRRVTRNGGIRWGHSSSIGPNNGWLFISQVLNEEPVGLEEVDNGIWSVYFGPVLLGRCDERELKLYGPHKVRSANCYLCLRSNYRSSRLFMVDEVWITTVPAMKSCSALFRRLKRSTMISLQIQTVRL